MIWGRQASSMDYCWWNLQARNTKIHTYQLNYCILCIDSKYTYSRCLGILCSVIPDDRLGEESQCTLGTAGLACSWTTDNDVLSTSGAHGWRGGGGYLRHNWLYRSMHVCQEVWSSKHTDNTFIIVIGTFSCVSNLNTTRKNTTRKL